MAIDEDNLVYRKATLKDINELIRFKLLLLDELNPNEDKSNLDIIINELDLFFSEYLERNEFIAWIAEYGGRIIATSGLVLWRIAPRYDCLHGRYGYILNMYTLPEFRRNGISTELLKKLIEEAKKLNVDILNLHATKDGINMYRRFGFKDPIDPEIELNLDNY